MRTIIVNCEKGFTVIELLITLVIASVLLAVAVPSFQSLMSDSQMTATTNDFVTSIHSARSEAVKRGTSAGVCPSNTPVSASAVCAAVPWTNGWIAFADDNGNAQRDAGEDLLAQNDARSNGFQFTPASVFSELIYFNSDGATTNSSGLPLSGIFVVKYGSSQTRNISISASGRISTETP